MVRVNKNMRALIKIVESVGNPLLNITLDQQVENFIVIPIPYSPSKKDDIFASM